MIYPARRQSILVYVLAFDGLISLGVACWMMWAATAGRLPPLFFGMGPFIFVSFLGAAWIILHSTYEIQGTDLIVRQGPSKRIIPIASIDEVFPTSASAPAFARDRLQLLFVPSVKERTIFLDPKDREAFLQGLAQADPTLTYDGQKLTRG